MKKLFTLMVMALVAMSVSAKSVVLWEGEAVFDNWSTNVKIDKENFASVKAGDKLVITAAPVEVSSWQWGGQVFVKTTRTGWAAIAETISVSAEGVYNVEISDKAITIEEGEGDTKTNVETTMLDELKNYGLAIQGMASKVTKIELVPAPEIKETKVLSTTEAVFDNWSTNVKIDKENFASVKAGDKLVITAAPVEVSSWQWGGQVFVKTTRTGWAAIAETISVSAEGVYNVEISDKAITIEEGEGDTKTNVETTMLDELKNYGLAIQGMASKVTKVELIIYKSEDEEATAGDTWNFETAVSAADKASLEAEGSTWKAPAITYVKDADGNPTTEISYVRYELNAEISAKVKDALGEFVALKGNNGTELEWTKGLTFTRYSNALKAGNIRLDAYSRLGLNGSGIAMKISGLKKDDIIKIKFASTNEEARGFELTNAATNDADAKTKILSGTDKAAVEFELKVAADGDVILQTTNGVYIYAIAVNAALPTGIQETVAPVKVIENNVIYNLAGQKVNENYKGIVIKNGKKYIQK